MHRSWFRAEAKADGEAEIVIYDEIGLWGIHARDFATELKALGNVDHIMLRINSPGGEVFDGIAIYNMLARHKASVTVLVDGIAASIASVIAMAGDAVVMPENAMMMIHDPAGMVVGTSDDMRELADILDKIKGSLVSAYAIKSGMDRGKIGELMAAETWLSADEAVDLGFADSLERPVAIAARFDLSKFKNAPQAMMPRRAPAAKAAPCPEKDIPMKDTPETGAAEVDAAVTEEIVTTPEAPAPAVAEPEAPEQVTAIVRDDERRRAADIVAICQNAGKPGKAAEFIASGKSAGDVAIALLSEAVSASPEISARHVPASATQPVDWGRAIERVNARTQ